MNDATNIPTPDTPDVCTIALLVDGKEIPSAFHVLSVTVNRELNRIPSASIQIADGEAAKATFVASNAEHFLPGKTIEIQLGYRANNQAVFKGTVVRQRVKVRKSGAVLSIECFADAVKTTSGRMSRYFVDKTDSEIIEEILDINGIAKDVGKTSAKHGQVVQYDATDWDFLLCRAEANGQVVMVEDDKVRIALPDAGDEPALKISYGSTVLELDAEIDARWQSKGIKASAWSAVEQALVEADGNEPKIPAAGNVAAADLAKVLGDRTDEVRHGGMIDEAQLQTWADARLLRMRLARLRGRVRCQGFAAVLPGKLVEITGIGERFEGKLYVSGVRHSVAGGNWETDVQFGLNPELFSETYDLRPLPAAGMLPIASGLTIGIVTALEDDPDGEHRVKCRLPVVGTDEDGIWARLATLDAGKDRGTFFRPEIDDEVVVGFLGDDPRQPVILGMCHSSGRAVPEAAKDTNHHKGYVSREKLKLTFDDDKKIIGLETPAGNSFALSEDAKGIMLKDQNGNKIVLDANGITIETDKDLVLKAGKDVKLSGMNTEFSAKSAFKASGTATAEMSGAQAKINGDAMTLIKGGMVHIN